MARIINPKLLDILDDEDWTILLTFAKLKRTKETEQISLKYLKNEINSKELVELIKEYLNKIDNKVEE